MAGLKNASVVLSGDQMEWSQSSPHQQADLPPESDRGSTSHVNTESEPDNPRQWVPFCTGPECEVCSDSDDDTSGEDIPEGAAGAWIQTSKMWRTRDQLKVHFLNPNALEGWKIGRAPMNVDNILAWAAEWNSALVPDIPTFVKTDSARMADVRVSFTQGSSWSKVGTDAKQVTDITLPTMNLFLKKLSPDFMKYLVIHEFGHVLGLEHEHQRSDFWKVASKFINVQAMMADHRMNTINFALDIMQLKPGGQTSEYDPDSVMHYWFDVDWLKKKKHKTLKGVESDRSLKKKEKVILRGIHKRNGSFAPGPSETDYRLLQKCYATSWNDSLDGDVTGGNISISPEPSAGPAPVHSMLQNCSDCSPLQSSYLDLVRKQLDSLRVIMSAKPQVINQVLQWALQDYITSFTKFSCINVEHLKHHLRLLHTEGLISDLSVYKWAVQVAEERVSQVTFDPVSSRKKPLFSKDVLYHASLCSLAVNSENMFEENTWIRGHNFKAVSISQSSKERYLVATQDESIYYFAFQGNSDISSWLKEYESFSEGLSCQTESVPINYIMELLKSKENRVVLTGFCFGGLLASSIATKIWSRPFIEVQDLQENLVCITFAQPHIPVPQLLDIAMEIPEIRSTLHAVYYENDVLPQVLMLLDQCCSTLVGRTDSNERGLRMSMRGDPRTAFEDPLTLELCQQLETLLESESTEVDRSTSCKELKRQLRDLSNIRLPTAQNTSRCMTNHSLSTTHDLSAGLSFNKMTSDQVIDVTTCLRAEDVHRLNREKHSMMVYIDKIVRGYLEKRQERYRIPDTLHAPTPFASLTPVVTGVVIQDQGPESCIVVEGNDLWFCYQLSINGVSVSIPPNIVSGSSIKVVVPESGGLSEVNDGEMITIVIDSHFCERQSVPTIVHKKECALTARERQIAKLSPSQLIELTYLSAVLERYPQGYLQFKQPSEKMKTVENFLDQASRVVPLEAIGYAIRCGTSYVAQQCAKALLERSQGIPSSSLMSDAINLAHVKFLSETSDHSKVDFTASPRLGRATHEHGDERVLCGYSIADVYPMTKCYGLESRCESLHSTKQELLDLVKKGKATSCGCEAYSCNSLVLNAVNNTRRKQLAIYRSLLGEYMEQLKINIPRDDFQTFRIMALERHSALTRKGILIDKAGVEFYPSDNPNVVEVQFEYLLELSIADLCEKRDVTEHYPSESMETNWKELFKESPLSLAAVSHRPMIARWVKWILMIHSLREKVAKFTTAVGVVGLVNSGKTKLVNSLFGIQVSSGTTEARRTTVPFIYSLKETVGDLDIVDFPGVDDVDESISDMANLLLTLAQVIIFTVDYRKVHCESSKKWLGILRAKKVPVLVCLTHADKLYSEYMTKDGHHPDEAFIKKQLPQQLRVCQERLHLPPSLCVKFCTFSQDRDSVFNSDDGRRRLRNVGIDTPADVGEWLVDTFKKRFGLSALAQKLAKFVHSERHDNV